jgi:Flp pilus assembly protein TadD
MADETLLKQGCAAFAAGRLAEAETAFRALAASCPDPVEALSNLAGVLNARHCYDEAEAVCRQALALAPQSWPAWCNLGTALHGAQRREEAVLAYAEALRRQPAHVATLTNLGVALAELGQLAPALKAHDAAVTLAPDDAEVHCNRALALLTAGDLAQGFAENEWRWQAPFMLPHGLPGPEWQGEDPAGRTILLHAEGGFGDTLQFIRYAPLLADRGAHVVLRVQPQLVRLLRRMDERLSVIAEGEALPPYDWRCPLLSLPHRFGTTLATVPNRIPYLHADSMRAASWRERLAGEGRRVGLVWAGASRPAMAVAHAMDSRRSLSLSAYAPFAAIAGVRLVSLQAGEAAHQPCPAGLTLIDPMGECRDFDDTAAVVANLDLVISVDTAVAHLAGGLGIPVWLLSRHDACWRWLHGRRDSPWYPAMRLYTQPAPGAWDPVLAELRHDLERWAA